MPGMSSAGSTGVAELVEVDADAEVGGGGSEDVAAGERRARRGEMEVRVVEHDGAARAAGDRDGRREQAVVGADENAGAVGDLDGDGARGRADARVDDGEHDAFGDVGDRSRRAQRSGADVVGADPVGEVDRWWRAGARSRITDFTTPTNSSSSP